MSSSDTSLVTNHFSTAAEGYVTTTAGSVNSGASTVPLNTTAGLVNGKVFVGIIEPGTSGKEQTFTGLVDTSGSQITNVVWTRGTNTSHSAGVSVVDYVSGTSHNMMTKGLLVEHSQDGTHANITPDSVTTPTLTVTSGSTFPAGDIVTQDYANASVTADKLATGAATAAVATSETTTSTTYVQLTTTTDNVTVTIGANGLALVVVSCQMFNVTAGGQPYMSFSVSGASTVAAADTSALSHKDSSTNGLVQGSYTKLLSGLTAGSNTFSAKYRTVANTATFLNREIAVIPL